MQFDRSGGSWIERSLRAETRKSAADRKEQPRFFANYFFGAFSIFVFSKKLESKNPSTLGALSTAPSVT